jgi:predicted transglutaminase-like cysteine proteinase
MRRLALGVLVTATIAGLSADAATLSKVYAWEYVGRTWTVNHAFDLGAYTHYRSLPRVAQFTDYGEYVLDPDDDGLIAELASELEQMADRAELDEWETLHLIVSFVQSLRYVPDQGEYPRYPIETLVEGCGDCEDLAILTAEIVRQMGFGVVLLAFTEEMHMAVGIRAGADAVPDGAAFEWNGDAYYYVETTAIGWAIGQMPTQYVSSPDIIALAPPTP